MARGFKTGGRSAGTPNKRTQARRFVEEVLREHGRDLLGPVLQQMQAPPRGGKKAIDVLQDLVTLAMNCVAVYQPTPTIGPDGRPTLAIDSDQNLLDYLKIAVSAAGELARYQSPTFKAIALQEVPLTPPKGDGATDAEVVGLLGKMGQQAAADAYARLVRKDSRAA